jgi:hypothetical protein
VRGLGDSDSFRALVNPGAQEANLNCRQRFWRWTKSAARSTRWPWKRPTLARSGRVRARTTRRRPSRAHRRRLSRTSGTLRAPSTRTMFWRHCSFLVNLGRGNGQEALLAVARNHYLAIFAAFEDAFTVVESQASLGSFFTVASKLIAACFTPARGITNAVRVSSLLHHERL